MTVPTFAHQQKQWSNLPVDDIGYLSTSELLAMPEPEFEALMEQATINRYDGWRNYRRRWERFLTRFDTTSGKRVLDYGSGIGIDAVQYAIKNVVSIADVNADNLRVAQRTFSLTPYEPQMALLIKSRAPFLTVDDGSFDVIYCSGVLHHIPKPEPVVCQMHKWLDDGGEIRLMVYSDKAWTIATGERPPKGPAEDDPGFERFTRHWDAVGDYADWYDERKLRERFGEWFDVLDYQPLTKHGEYVAARLVKR